MAEQPTPLSDERLDEIRSLARISGAIMKAALTYLLDEIDRLKAEVRGLKTENERLRAALKEHGYHAEKCGASTWSPPDAERCTCGLRAAIVEMAE